MSIFFKNRNYRKFAIASFLSGAGDILFYLAFMTYASKLRNYSLALSLIAISESVPKLFEIFGGYLADKTQHKFRNIFLMAVIRFALYAIVGFLFVAHISDWNLVLAVVIINFFSDTFGSYSGGLTSPLIVDLVGKEDFGEAEGFTSGINQVINIGAQFLGSGLLLFMSYSSLAFVNAFTFLAAGLLYASVGLKFVKEHKRASTSEQVNEQGFWTTMKTSFKQVRKQYGLLTIILVIALLNGALDALQALVPVVIAGHRGTMIIGHYSFTIALLEAVAGIGLVLGSLLSSKLFKKISLFAIVIWAMAFGILASIAALLANIYFILPVYFLMGMSAGVATIKLTQWLVTSVGHQILATSAGLLNTILMAVAPLMTTLLTTISGSSNVQLALLILLIIEVLTLLVGIRLSISSRKKTVRI